MQRLHGRALVGKSIVVLNFFATPGHELDASTRWEGNGVYRLFLYNYYTGKSWAADQATNSGWVGDSAEAVAERPSIGGSLSNLSNFGTLTFAWAKANGIGFDRYSPSGQRYAVRMVDSSGNYMAVPSDIGSYGYFTDRSRGATERIQAGLWCAL